ncbi:ribosomal protein S10 domain-containing protein [Lipomyces arxii]|uniref:mitochondrial 37S ribosomal protein uS10m n=1 Tax=Lipomyces arxii TaxID=56418 RepID=UPI0034CEB997
MTVRIRPQTRQFILSFRRFASSGSSKVYNGPYQLPQKPEFQGPEEEEWMVDRPYYFDPQTQSLHVPSLFQPGKTTGRPLPLNVELTHFAPMKIPKTNKQHVCDLTLISHSAANIEFFADFALRAAFYLNIPAHGTIPLPTKTKRYTIVKSPFAHTKKKVNFEQVTHKRLIQLFDANLDTVETWLGFLRKYEYAGVALKSHVYNYESIDLDID